MPVSVIDAVSTGEYRDERLYLLKTIERLEEAQTKQFETLGGVHKLLDKCKLDLNEAHRRIKNLQTGAEDFARRLMGIEVRAGYIAAGVGLVVGLVSTILFELGKNFFSR